MTRRECWNDKRRGYLDDKKRRYWDEKRWATGMAGEGGNEMTPKGICALSKIGYKAKRTFF